MPKNEAAMAHLAAAKRAAGIEESPTPSPATPKTPTGSLYRQALIPVTKLSDEYRDIRDRTLNPL
jgi:hypothetical protein